MRPRTEHRCASVVGASELRETIVIPLLVLGMLGVAGGGLLVVDEMNLRSGWAFATTIAWSAVAVVILALFLRLPTVVRVGDDGLRFSWGIARWSLPWTAVLGVELHAERLLILRRDRVGGEWLRHREPDTHFSDTDPLVVALHAGIERERARIETTVRIGEPSEALLAEHAFSPERDAERGYRDALDRAPQK